MSIYTKTSENIYFLNDKNIATSMDDAAVLSNAIPSFDIVSAAYDEFDKLRDAAILSIGNLCVHLSTDVKNLSATVNDNYVHLTGDSMTGSLSIAQRLTVDNDVQFKQNLHVLNNLTQGKGSYVDASIDRGIAVGISSIADKNDAFVWNGNDAVSYNAQDNKAGSFNINPRGGTTGFYVGSKNLSAIIHDDVLLSSNSLTSQINDISGALSNWVDARRTNDKAELSNVLSSYSNSLCTSLSNTVDTRRTNDKSELSNVLSGYTDKLVSDLSTSLSNTVKDAGYALYNDFVFEYNDISHYLSISLKDQNGRVTTQAVDTTDFIKNRIVDHIDVQTVNNIKVLRLYWKDPTGALDYTDIKLSDFAALYHGGDGITITDTLSIYVNRYNELTACLTQTSADVNTLSNQTLPNLTTRVDSLESYTRALSTDNNGIIKTLSNDLHSLSDNISADVNTLSNNIVAGIRTDVNTVLAHANSIQKYADQLSGASGWIGDVPYLSNNIDSLRLEIRGAANFCGYVSMSKAHPHWVIEAGGDTSISAFFKYAINHGTENAIKNGNIYEIVFIEDGGVMSDPEFASQQYYDTSDGVRLAHKCFIAVVRPDGSVEVPLTEITKDTVRIIAGEWYRPYQLSVQISADHEIFKGLYNKIQNINTNSTLSAVISSLIEIKNALGNFA